jgi:cytoskeletal protein RodZ
MDDFGGKLRQAREGHGVSLRQIAANTKIPLSTLEALERNDISKLPAGIFSRSFVRAYAAEVGLDPDDTVHEFTDRFEIAAPPPLPVQIVNTDTFEDDTRRAAIGMGIKAVLGVLALVFIFGFFSWRGGDSAETSAANAPPSQPRAEVATTPAPTTPPAAPAVDDVLRATGPLKLEIHPTGPCWIKLTVDGEDVFAKLMQKGERETVTVNQAAVISIGDAGAFAYSVDGRQGKPLGGSGEVKTARISRDTLAEYLR